MIKDLITSNIQPKADPFSRNPNTPSHLQMMFNYAAFHYIPIISDWIHEELTENFNELGY